MRPPEAELLEDPRDIGLRCRRRDHEAFAVLRVRQPAHDEIELSLARCQEIQAQLAELAQSRYPTSTRRSRSSMTSRVSGVASPTPRRNDRCSSSYSNASGSEKCATQKHRI